MSDIKKLIQQLDEMTSGAVASVAMPMGEVIKRSGDDVVEASGPEKAPKVESPRNWGDWKNPSLAGVKKAKRVSESADVTDYNPKSQGGTRKELLAKYHKTKDPKDAEAARKAGATQRELKGVTEGGEKDRQWSKKDMEKLRVATRDFDDIMASDGPEAFKQELTKKRIQTKPMAGPKGVLPEQDVAEGPALSTSTLTGEIPTLMGLRKKEQGDLIEKYALYNREKDYFELFVELSGKPMSEIYNMNDSHQLANELYNLGSQIASDWRNISNPKFSRREYLNQIMSDWYNLFKKSIQKYKSMKQSVTEDASSIKKKISKYEELALAANRSGDDEKCKLYQRKIQALKQKMSQDVAEGFSNTPPMIAKLFSQHKQLFDLAVQGKISAELKEIVSAWGQSSPWGENTDTRDKVWIDSTIKHLLQNYYPAWKKGQDVAEGSEVQKTFKVIYHSPKTDRTVTKMVKGTNESEIWDKLHLKGIQVISVSEQGVAEGLDQPKEAGKAIQSLKNLAVMKSALTMQQLTQAGREAIVSNAIDAAKTLEQKYLQNKQQGNAIFVRALRDEIDNFMRGAPINASFPETDNASELGDLLQGKLGKVNFQQGVAEDYDKLSELKKSTVRSYASKKQAEIDDVPPFPFKKPAPSNAEHEKNAKGMMGALARLSGKKPTSEGESEDDSCKIEAHGVYGMKSKPWRKIFKSQEAFERWLDKNEGNVEVHGTRELERSITEGEEFGAYYYEQLAQKVFDANPSLESEDAILKAGYKIAVQDLDSKTKANHLFTWDEDFPGDFISSYRWLCKNAGENITENRVDSPVSSAIIRRILNQRTDLLAKFGPAAVTDAVDTVAEWNDDVEEIGSSDVSAWVSQVERMLRTRAGEGLGEQYSIAEAGPGRSYDMHIEIMNPAYIEWEKGGGDDDNPPEETIEVGVDYSIYGQHRPATWGYSGGSPEEHPEIDEMRVYNLETGEELTNLDSDTLDAIEEKIWDNNEGGGDDGDDYYDDSRDDYYESRTTEGKTGPGLWANIRAKRERIKSGSGERMRKPGSEGAPSEKSLKAARQGS